MRLTLRKNEILRGHQSFSTVLSRGKALQAGVLRCFFLLGDEYKGGIRVGFAVSRTVRGSLLRNRLRRLMREAYRTNKAILRTGPAARRTEVQAVFMCTLDTSAPASTPTHGVVERSMIELLANLQREL